jgi:hypothetical protein
VSPPSCEKPVRFPQEDSDIATRANIKRFLMILILNFLIGYIEVNSSRTYATGVLLDWRAILVILNDISVGGIVRSIGSICLLAIGSHEDMVRHRVSCHDIGIEELVDTRRDVFLDTRLDVIDHKMIHALTILRAVCR